jgi:putative oxidoreductase
VGLAGEKPPAVTVVCMKLLTPLTGTARDVVLLIARVVLGVVLFAHGFQKLFTYGFGGVTASFTKMGVPLPAVSAAYATVVELVGGALLVVGAGTAVVAVLVALDMLGASLTTGSYSAVLVSQHGFELEGAILAAALALLAAGAGRFSVDHLLLRRRHPIDV